MAQTELTITLAKAADLLLTLQYALETFEGTCQCGECDPCTEGQEDLKRAIENVQQAIKANKAKSEEPAAEPTVGLDQSGQIAELYREAAKDNYERAGEVEIDPGAVVSVSEDGGAYVAAWVWIGNDEVDGLCSECGGLANEGEGEGKGGYDGKCRSCADKAEAQRPS